jgi:hypothetical protein
MSNIKSMLKFQFFQRSTSPLKEIMKKVRGIDVPIEFDLTTSRRFQVGNQAAILSHLAKQTTILAVVAFSIGGGSEYIANRMVVLEPENNNHVLIKVLSMDGKLHYRGSGVVIGNKLMAEINVTLPGIPVEVRMQGELTATGEIRMKRGTFGLRKKARTPSASSN